MLGSWGGDQGICRIWISEVIALENQFGIYQIMTAPFGIEFFSDLSRYEVIDDLVDSKFRIKAPSPHPMFDDYIVQYTDLLGVVWIKGIGPYNAIDIFGNSLRSNVDRAADQLSMKYGKYEKTDFLITGSMWDEPQYWMNALEDGQRHYCFMWTRKSCPSLPDDIESIYVGADVTP